MPRIRLLLLSLILINPIPAYSKESAQRTKQKTFDFYWDTLHKKYPYFELQGVDWDLSRKTHRKKALAAKNQDDFVHELAKMFAELNDPHLMFYPPLERWEKEGKRWTIPQIQVVPLREGVVIIDWPDDEAPRPPEQYRDSPHVLPVLRTIDGTPPGQAVSLILLAGPPKTPVDLVLQWPDGTETDHRLIRPESSPPHRRMKVPQNRWIRSRTFGDLGYLALLSFNPKMTEEGYSGSQMRQVFLDEIKKIQSTKQLIIDMRYNGGGHLHLVRVLLNRFLNEPATISMKTMTFDLEPLDPHYHGEVIVLTNEFSGSGGEWFPAFMQHYGRAKLVGGVTSGAEGAVTKVQGPDGSTLKFGFNNLTEKQGFQFQRNGVRPDHIIPLTIKEIRTLGAEEAIKKTERSRVRKALDLLRVRDPDANIEMGISEWTDDLLDLFLRESGKLSIPRPD